MPGVVQVWLTDDELDLLRDWGENTRHLDLDGWGPNDTALLDKLYSANEAVTCIQPQPCPVCRNVRNKADGSVAFCSTCRPEPEDGGW